MSQISDPLPMNNLSAFINWPLTLWKHLPEYFFRCNRLVVTDICKQMAKDHFGSKPLMKIQLVSISSTFNSRLLCTKVFTSNFCLLKVWLCNFLARKTLMKLITDLNFIIFCELTFLHILLWPKNYEYPRTAYNIFIWKNLHIKCWWNWHLQSISPTFYKHLLHQYSFAKNYKTKQ